LMSLWIADGTRILNLTSIFNIIFSSPSGIAKHDQRCLQFAVTSCKVNTNCNRLSFATAQKVS
jgi:hypothetical protein